jgi:hypothetical protein
VTFTAEEQAAIDALPRVSCRCPPDEDGVACAECGDDLVPLGEALAAVDRVREAGRRARWARLDEISE